jgi:type I restriction enzyme M protein
VEDALVAVVSLPAGVFNPYSGVKTSILILDKGLARQSDSIAFFKVENDGYDLGAQRRPIDKNDLPGLTKEIQEYLEKLRTGKEISVKDEAQIVQKEKIAANGEHNLGGDRYCKEDKQRSLDVEWVAIGALCELFNGRAFKPEEWEKPENGGIPIVRIQNLNNRESAFNYYSGETSEKNTIENGELLFSWSGSRGTSFGAHIWGGGRAVLNQHIFKVVFNPTRILKEYFYYALNEAVSEVEDNLHGGVGLVHITKGNLEKIEIPLPPLEVQKEIVAEIEGYQMVIDGARSVVENYKPQIPIDPKWQLADLESVCTFQEGPGILAKDFRQSGIPLVRLAGLTTGTVTLQGCDYLEPNMVDDRWSHFRLKQGDILVSTSASFGRPARVTTEAEGAVFYTGLIRFSPLVPALKSHFMEAFLGSTYFLKQAESLATGSSIRHFGPKHLRQMKMPLPPPEAQLEIIADLKKEKEMVEANKELSARFEKKIQAVMARVWGNGTAE